MSDLDQLRRSALAADEDPFENIENFAPSRREVDDGKIFGLTAVERMFLSIGLFLISVITSFVMLMGTNSIELP